MIYDKSKIITPAVLARKKDTSALFHNSLMKGLDGNPQEIYEGADQIELERSSISEFEFDGFSVIVEDGRFAVQFEDPEDGLVMQYLIDEGDIEPKFPYLFEVDGIDKVLTEEDYRRIKDFIEKNT